MNKIFVPGEPEVPDYLRAVQDAADSLEATLSTAGLDQFEMAIQAFFGMMLCKAKINALIVLTTGGYEITEKSFAVANAAALQKIESQVIEQLKRPLIARTGNVERAIRET